jgi:hypothetical protein
MTKFCSFCTQTLHIALFPKRKSNKDGLDTYCKNWNAKNRVRRREINKNYAIKNRHKVLQDMRNWYQINAEQCKRNIAKRTKERESTDINFKLKRRIRSRLFSAIRHEYKTGSAVADLGCSIEDFKMYIQQQFESGMNWDNYGRWEIDHIIPLVTVDLTDRKSFLKVVHYSNMRPLWKKDNLDRRFAHGKDKNKD